jgi:hypothetical protein
VYYTNTTRPCGAGLAVAANATTTNLQQLGRVSRIDPSQDLDQSRFPSAVRAYQSNDFSGLYLQAHLVEHPSTVKALCHSDST